MRQEASEQISYMRPRGRTKCRCFYLYYAIVILSFWYFLKIRFSVRAPIRNLGATRTETVGLRNPGPCLGDAWTVSPPATRSESLRNPQICSCGRRLLARPEFPTSPPKLIPLNSKGLSRGTQSQSGVGSDPRWSQQRKGGRRSQLSAGVACPQEILRYLHHLRGELQVAEPAGGRAMPRAGDEPCCDISVRQWFPTGFPFLILVDFPALCMRCTRCLW